MRLLVVTDEAPLWLNVPSAAAVVVAEIDGVGGQRAAVQVIGSRAPADAGTSPADKDRARAQAVADADVIGIAVGRAGEQHRTTILSEGVRAVGSRAAAADHQLAADREDAVVERVRARAVARRAVSQALVAEHHVARDADRGSGVAAADGRQALREAADAIVADDQRAVGVRIGSVHRIGAAAVAAGSEADGELRAASVDRVAPVAGRLVAEDQVAADVVRTVDGCAASAGVADHGVVVERRAQIHSDGAVAGGGGTHIQRPRRQRSGNVKRACIGVSDGGRAFSGRVDCDVACRRVTSNHGGRWRYRPGKPEKRERAKRAGRKPPASRQLPRAHHDRAARGGGSEPGPEERPRRPRKRRNPPRQRRRRIERQSRAADAGQQAAPRRADSRLSDCGITEIDPRVHDPARPLGQNVHDVTPKKGRAPRPTLPNPGQDGRRTPPAPTPSGARTGSRELEATPARLRRPNVPAPSERSRQLYGCKHRALRCNCQGAISC